MEGGETRNQYMTAELIRYAPDVAPHDGGARNISTRFVSESSNLGDINGIFFISKGISFSPRQDCQYS